MHYPYYFMIYLTRQLIIRVDTSLHYHLLKSSMIWYLIVNKYFKWSRDMYITKFGKSNFKAGSSKHIRYAIM